MKNCVQYDEDSLEHNDSTICDWIDGYWGWSIHEEIMEQRWQNESDYEKAQEDLNAQIE